MSIRQPILAAFAPLVLCSVLSQAAIGKELSLQNVIDAARNNLDVVLAQRALAAARADVTAADHAPLPTLSAKAASIDLQNGIGGGNVITQKRIDKSVGVDWTWERGDKRRIRTEAALHTAQAAEADVADMRLQQSIAASAAYFDLLAANERVSEVGAIEKSASDLARTAARRVQAGDLAVQDAARSGIEAERARADLETARLDRRRAALGLSQLIGMPVDAEAPAIDAAWPALEAIDGAEPSVDRRPDVLAALERVQAARLALANASALKKTDVTWGTSIDHFPGTSTRQVEVRMQMPLQWGYGYDGEIRRAQAQLDQAESQLEKTRRTAANEQQRLLAELRSGTDRRRRYETDILPAARRVAEMAELANRKGALTLTDLLDARRTLRATLLDALAARADHAKALSAWQLRAQASDAIAPIASADAGSIASR